MSTSTALGAPAPPPAAARPRRLRRIIQLHLVAPSVFLGIPWLIVGAAWVVSMVIGALIRSSTGAGAGDSMRYSWAVLSPQWYLIVVGVQAVGLTFPYALGVGSTRRDFWVGTMTLFGLLAVGNSVAFATLVQLEKATGGWRLDIRMFDALWYGLEGWWVDFSTSVALQVFVLVLDATAASIYMRWRMRGMVIAALAGVAVILTAVTVVTLTNSWEPVGAWFVQMGLTGGFSLLLTFAGVLTVAGYAVIRRATPRN